MNRLLFTVTLLIVSQPVITDAQTFVKTDAYCWHGDTVTQGDYTAIAQSPFHIISDYHAQPGYYMGIESEWSLVNDISSYPQLTTPNNMHAAIYNMALDEMVNAVQPDMTLRTGAAWGGVWTRDISYSIILSMAYMQPEAARVSLMKKVDSLGRIIQDTGSGGAWPVSTDRVIWAVAAYEVYLSTGDIDWLKTIYPIIKQSLEDDREVVHDNFTGLIKGETSFIDWREQSHPRWMQTADIASTLTLSTSAVHCKALKVLSEIEAELGYSDDSRRHASWASEIAQGINDYLWLDDKGYYGMYLYGGDNLIMNPRAETLGESLAILWDIAPAERAISITCNNPTTPFGVGIFYPQIVDIPPYHNNSLWPWVASFWALANAKAGNEEGTLQAIGSIVRPAALFCTNKENFVLDNGDIATQLNSSNMLWCLSGNIALTHKLLFGINFSRKGLEFKPFIPKSLAAKRTLTNFKYRDALLNITINGYGDSIKSFVVNGKPQKASIIDAHAHGVLNIEIVMNDCISSQLNVNAASNLKAPVTPSAQLNNNILSWNPIYETDHYEVICNGKLTARVNTTTFDAGEPGEYQIIAVDQNGTPSFASQPCSNRETYSFEVQSPKTEVQSREILYPVTKPIHGYTGQGFAETDHKTPTVSIPVTVPDDGNYSIRLRYANGNGSVFTGNSAAVRTLKINDNKAGTVVMPHRGEGNWNEWGMSSNVIVHLAKGSHMITLTFEPSDENMNIKTNHALIDAVHITKMP